MWTKHVIGFNARIRKNLRHRNMIKYSLFSYKSMSWLIWRKILSEKLEKDKINLEILKRGYLPIDFKVGGYLDDICFMDKNGYKYSIKWENFKSSKNFKQITYSNPYSVENAKLYLKLNNIPIELISDNIELVTLSILFKMECGHTESITWNGMKRRKRYVCWECYNKNIKGKDRKTTDNDVIDTFELNGSHILDIKEFKNQFSSITVFDDNGYYGKSRYVDAVHNKKFNKFLKMNPYTIRNINHYLDINGINLKLLSNEYKNCDESLLWECSCGNKFYKKWDYIRSGRERHCDFCMSKSNIEDCVAKFLTKNVIDFEREYKFEDCRDKNRLPFDFYLPKYNTCIEIDGEQHYKPIRFGGMEENESIERFNKQTKRDIIKDDYCKDNNIKLLRIPYWFFNNKKEFEEKINQYLI